MDLDIIDPNGTLPPIKTQGKEIDPRDLKFINEQTRKYNNTRKNVRDEEGFSTIKRKERSPEKEIEAKRRNLNSTPEKCSKNISDFINGIRNPLNEMLDERNKSRSDTEELETEDEGNQTVIIPDNAENDKPEERNIPEKKAAENDEVEEVNDAETGESSETNIAKTD